MREKEKENEKKMKYTLTMVLILPDVCDCFFIYSTPPRSVDNIIDNFFLSFVFFVHK